MNYDTVFNNIPIQVGSKLNLNILKKHINIRVCFSRLLQMSLNPLNKE